MYKYFNNMLMLLEWFFKFIKYIDSVKKNFRNFNVEII